MTGHGQPLVSFVVINYNYAEYVAEAINSILAQTYRNFECVVLDNNSSDGSRSVLSEFVARDPRLTVRFLDRNLNQMGALLHVLDDLRGKYLAIVDADDFVFPDYAASHVQAHELAGCVAFTSCCVIEVDADGAPLTGGYDPFLARLGKNEAKTPIPQGDSDRFSRSLRENVRPIGADSQGWRWSPGTANMHDLSLVRATRPTGHADIYVSAPDNYFMWLNHAISGSAQILTPLSAYRHHGRNRYGAIPSISGLEIGTRSGVRRSAVRRRDITQALTSRPAYFDKLAPGRYWKLMDAPAAAEGLPVQKYFSNPMVQRIIAANYDRLSEAFGSVAVERELTIRLGRKSAREIRLASKILVG